MNIYREYRFVNTKYSPEIKVCKYIYIVIKLNHYYLCGENEVISLFPPYLFSFLREDVDVEAVFLHPDEPELEFVGFLKKKYPRVRYFQGSLMESIDLERVQVISKSIPGLNTFRALL